MERTNSANENRAEITVKIIDNIIDDSFVEFMIINQNSFFIFNIRTQITFLFSKLDVASQLFQMECHVNRRNVFAFNLENGLFEVISLDHEKSENIYIYLLSID